ncbi:MAG TPA: hypothetical protein ENF75_04705 [Acidilobales archaeon]|nr:hypothetical protein [Acidilobales archaeon]
MLCHDDYVLLASIRGVKGLEKVYLLRRDDVINLRDLRLMTYLKYMRFKVSLCDEEVTKAIENGKEISLNDLTGIKKEFYDRVNEVIKVLSKVLKEYVALISAGEWV